MNAPTNINLRKDQWDLIVLALERIRMMADSANHPAEYTVDRLGREFLKRRIVETVADIQTRLPEAGK